jgi:hypothetical protein
MPTRKCWRADEHISLGSVRRNINAHCNVRSRGAEKS